MTKEKVIVSACLAGVPCRYDGASKTRAFIQELLENNQAIPLCPEQLGGLSTPRPAAERIGHEIKTIEGKDVTEPYAHGAKAALELALRSGANKAYLKSKSPMCGCTRIYDGTFKGKLTAGDGVFTQLLRSANFTCEEVD